MYLIPDAIYKDESLESYLLRIAVTNCFESYSLLSTAIREHLGRNDVDAYGTFPVELGLVNIYHAKHSSSYRLRAIRLVEQLVGAPDWLLYNLALKHTRYRISSRFSLLERQGHLVPRCFLRRNGIPVCSVCLEESSYIRQSWHYLPYRCCHEHGVHLVDSCPECGTVIDYIQAESITHCTCGYDLRSAKTKKCSKSELRFSRLLSGANISSRESPLESADISMRHAALLWYFRCYRNADELTLDDAHIDEALKFFDGWPANLFTALKVDAKHAEKCQVQGYNKSAFQDVFGKLLLQCRLTPLKDSGNDFVHNAVLRFLVELLIENPRSAEPNVCDLLLTVPEAASVMGTSHEQIYRYYEEGMLTLAFRPSLHNRLGANVPAFHLREVLELHLSLAGAGADMLAAW